MRRLISSLLIGSIITLLYRRFRRPTSIAGWMNRRMGGMSWMDIPRWLRKLPIKTNGARIISMVIGRKWFRKMAR
ncbi:hypothetical protein SAMN05444487_10551 [Marininema mesophilum]|uniref:Uncharacterized protein n=1 Tax=Marininema mesophilum TaxID=1048340 RepID=A0A1H2VCM8_9BACL|nr:hypothetical protein [Marininema mesophilum]SDW65639.1 hypothetical protein SAMN05444487_10551 [Marininema mesophilum]